MRRTGHSVRSTALMCEQCVAPPASCYALIRIAQSRRQIRGFSGSAVGSAHCDWWRGRIGSRLGRRRGLKLVEELVILRI